MANLYWENYTFSSENVKATVGEILLSCKKTGCGFHINQNVKPKRLVSVKLSRNFTNIRTQHVDFTLSFQKSKLKCF